MSHPVTLPMPKHLSPRGKFVLFPNPSTLICMTQSANLVDGKFEGTNSIMRGGRVRLVYLINARGRYVTKGLYLAAKC